MNLYKANPEPTWKVGEFGRRTIFGKLALILELPGIITLLFLCWITGERPM